MLQAFKALADANRLKILQLLVEADLCVGALAVHLGISKPAVSQHLQTLRRAGLVKGQKRGYWTHYRVNRQALTRIADGLNALAAGDEHCRTACSRILGPSPQAHHAKEKEADTCQNCCQQPIQLQDKPELCSPEQIHKCHGEATDHPFTKGEGLPAERSVRSD